MLLVVSPSASDAGVFVAEYADQPSFASYRHIEHRCDVEGRQIVRCKLHCLRISHRIVRRDGSLTLKSLEVPRIPFHFQDGAILMRTRVTVEQMDTSKLRMHIVEEPNR